MEIYEIIKQLEDTPGTNDKLAILKSHKDNKELKQFFYMTKHSHIIFYIKKIPAYEFISDSLNLSNAMDQLYELSSRAKTGQAGIDHIIFILSNCTPESADLIKRIIKKDPDCKVGRKLVNKVWKKLIPITPYMRCASCNEKNYSRINFPALIQKKADGLFINNIVKEGLVLHESRNGKFMNLHGQLDTELLAMKPGSDYVVMGEGLVLDGHGGVLSRKTGNGIISKAIHGSLSKEEAKNIILEVWDIIPYEVYKAPKHVSNTYEYRRDRYNQLLKFLGKPGNNWTKQVQLSKINIIETAEIESMDEARKYFKGMIDRGEEGAILKNFTGLWKDGTSNDCVKMKIADPADLLCTGTYPHKKYPELIGGLNLESSDGIIKVNTGSGLDDEDRKRDPSYFIDKIIELEYNDITDDKKTKQKSLFLPIYKGIRDDKDEADSYKLILERSTQKKLKV